MNLSQILILHLQEVDTAHNLQNTDFEFFSNSVISQIDDFFSEFDKTLAKQLTGQRRNKNNEQSMHGDKINKVMKRLVCACVVHYWLYWKQNI